MVKKTTKFSLSVNRSFWQFGFMVIFSVWAFIFYAPAGDVWAAHLGAGSAVYDSNCGTVSISKSYTSSGTSPNGSIGVTTSVTSNLCTNTYWAILLYGQITSSNIQDSGWIYQYGTGISHTFNFSGLGAGEYTVSGDAILYYWNGSGYSYYATLSTTSGSVTISTDVCPNITGGQSSVPAGMIIDSSGNCVTPPPPSSPVTVDVFQSDQFGNRISDGPITVNRDSTAYLSWTSGGESYRTCNVATCPITFPQSSNSCDTLQGTASIPLSNSSFGTQQTFIGTCVQDGNTIQNSLVVNVVPSILANLSAASTNITAGVVNSLTAIVGGNATGNIRYQFDCTSNGSYEADVTTSANPYTSSACSYSTVGAYTATVRVTREGVSTTQTTPVSVWSPVAVDIKLNNSNAPASSPVSIFVGQTASASWVTSGAQYCYGYWDNAPKNLNTSENVGSTLQPGSYAYTLTCWNAASGYVSDSAYLNVTQPPFDYSMANSGNISVTQGGSGTNSIFTTLTSGNTQPVTFSLSGLPAGASYSLGQSACSPTCFITATISTLTTTPAGVYTITASGSPNSHSTQYTLTVNALPPVINSFSASVSTVIKGQSLNLTWGSSNTTSCTASNSLGNSDWSGSSIGTGSTKSVTPTATNTYNLTCSGAGGSVSATPITVTVYEPGSLRIASPVSPVVVREESTLQIRAYLDPDGSGPQAETEVTNSAAWSSANTSKATVSNASPTKGLVTGVRETSSVAISVNFTDSYGNTRTGSISIRVDPLIEIGCTPSSGNPNPILTGQNISFTTKDGNGTYTWTATGGSPSSGSGASFATSFSSSGNKTIQVASSYLSATCAVSVETPSLTINTMTATPSSGTGSLSNVSFSASISSNILGTSNYTFYCDYPGTSTAFQPGWAAKYDGTADMSKTTGAVCNYNSPGTYSPKVIVERGSLTKEKRATVTVAAPPVPATITSFTATPSSITRGATSNLAWQTSNAVGGCAASANPVTTQWSGSVSASSNKNVTPALTTTYTLTCQGESGSAAATASVTVNVYGPSLRVDPTTASIMADNDTKQLRAYYDSDGAGSAAETEVTSSASWSSSNTQKATVGNSGSSKGLVTGQSPSASVTITASYTDAYGNALSATSAVTVTARPTLSCSPSSQTVFTNQTASLSATGGTSNYQWTATGGSPSSGNQSSFSTSYGSVGAKTVIVASGSQTNNCTVTVQARTLSTSLSATPSSADVSLSTTLQANITSSVSDTTNYSFWWDCNNTTTDVQTANNACGALPGGVWGSCVENSYGSKCDGINANSKSVAHTYSSIGTYHPKVIAEHDSAPNAQALATATVTIPHNDAPGVTLNAPQAPADYAVTPFGWTLSWNYSDPQSDPQGAYQLVITDTSNGQVVKDTGQVSSASNSYAIPVGTLDFNKTYSWTIKVWDGNPYNPMASGTVGGQNFTTIKHAAPAVNFTWTPTQISQDQQVTFLDTTSFAGGATGVSWQWTFPADATIISGGVTAPQVVLKFSSRGSKTVSLVVTDSDGLVGHKTATNVNVSRSIPSSIQEIFPR